MSSHSRDRDEIEAVIGEMIGLRVPAAAGVLAARGPAASLPALGLDSVQMVEILLEVETRFGVAATEEWVREADLTVERLIDLITAGADPS
ncbi:MAG TPA: phosphopantetheine-binding protein [Thermoanaerobaculia bacterium]|nr:phosphopantetheine-binding protein [Thermoanaerobaculia bacterium]